MTRRAVLMPADLATLARVFGFRSVEAFGEFVVDQDVRADEREGVS